MKKLVAYITASYPENNFTVDLAFKMQEAGVDTLELGIPFSDPVADGPVIEKANQLALENNFKLTDLFEVTKQIAPNMDTLWMGYMNPFYRYGMEKFMQQGKEFGVKGMIIPDLPHEEALLYEKLAHDYSQALISFVAPTHHENRIKDVVTNAKEFIYMVAYAGITGSGKSEDLSFIIQTVKKYSQTPLYIGFGVDEKTCEEKAKGVDGVIVGSAFVKHLIDDSLSYTEKTNKICEIAKTIKQKINQ